MSDMHGQCIIRTFNKFKEFGKKKNINMFHSTCQDTLLNHLEGFSTRNKTIYIPHREALICSSIPTDLQSSQFRAYGSDIYPSNEPRLCCPLILFITVRVTYSIPYSPIVKIYLKLRNDE